MGLVWHHGINANLKQYIKNYKNCKYFIYKVRLRKSFLTESEMRVVILVHPWYERRASPRPSVQDLASDLPPQDQDQEALRRPPVARVEPEREEPVCFFQEW